MEVPGLVEHLFRRQASQMVATLTRWLGARHLTLAEESVQDALISALQQWPFGGVPDDPGAWLFQVARNRARDRLRHERIEESKAPAVRENWMHRTDMSAPESSLSTEAPPLADDVLGMMFMTCHPRLPHDSRVALTLKIAGGFSTREIARAFLAEEAAVSQRIVRAKRVLREHDVAFGPPDAQEMQARLDSVLEVIYLMFNEGYAATSGDALLREDVCAEAIRLAGLVVRHPITAAPKAQALVALLLLQAARFPARVSSDGELYLLRDQDRRKWDRTLVAEGLRALERAAAGDELTRYHLEAEIAAAHAVAPSWEETDWRRILDAYDRLLEITHSPIVALNRAIAYSRLAGPRAAIAAVERIRHASMAGYHLLPAVLAELWREAGDVEQAATYYRAALGLARAGPERRFLAAQLDGL